MIRALYSAATGLFAQQMQLDVIANNIANVNTSGFKKSRIDFQDLMYESLRASGKSDGDGKSTNGLEVGSGVQASGSQKLYSQGPLTQTENSLDIAIEGGGFFQVLAPDGAVQYTRGGGLVTDADGRLLGAGGYLLEPAITLPADTLQIGISADGKVTVTTPGNATPTEIGQIQLARFINPAGLKSIGDSLYVSTVASGDAVTSVPGTDGLGRLRQGFLESSNVKVVEEMVAMIQAQRAFEVNSKTVRAADEMLSQVNNLTR